MRITAPVTDYIRESVLTTQGDLAVRGAAVVERLAGGNLGRVLSGRGAGVLPMYLSLFNLLTTTGDIWAQGVGAPTRLAAGAAGTYLQGKGAGVLPAYESSMPPLTTQGDLIVQGAAVPERIVAAAWGRVLMDQGAGIIPIYKDLFNLLTTQGDLWVRGAVNPQRIAAGLLDTYFKGQGAGALPIYEKLALRDTGVKIGNSARSTSGDEVITGVGFRPSVVIFFARDDSATDINLSWGFDDGTTSYMMRIQQDGTLQSAVSGASLYIMREALHNIRGSISALGADGFTITWILTGTCGCTFFYLCLP